MAVNLEKQQSLSLLPGWRTCLAFLQGFAPVPRPINHPLFGSWRGDEVHLVTAGHTQQPEVIVEIMALQVLQRSKSNPAPYGLLREQCQDVTSEVADFIAATPDLRECRFEEMVGRRDDNYSWLTRFRLYNLLHGIMTPIGPEFYHQYVLWLASRPGLCTEAREHLSREMRRWPSESESGSQQSMQQP